MDNVNNKVAARLDSKKLWVTLWIFALLGLLLSLRSLSLIKPKTCIVLCVVSLVLCGAGTLIGLYSGRTLLEISEKLVYCKTLFGKQIYIPIDSVTAIKVTGFGTVCIFAPSCRLACPFVTNKDEIVRAVKEKLETRQ